MAIKAKNSLTLIRTDDGLPAHVHNAWSWSEDGTDRFTTVYPNENILVNSKDYSSKWAFNNAALAEILEADGTPTKIIKFNYNPNGWVGVYQAATVGSWNKRPKSGDTVTLSFYARGNGRIYSTIDGVTGAINQNATNEWNKYSLSDIATKDVGNVSIYFHNILTSATSIFIHSVKFEINGEPTIYTPSPSEDPSNAYPHYMGTYSDNSPTASTNPADYHWQADPTWLEYSKVNGDDFDNATNTIYEALEDKANSSELEELNHMATKLDNDYKAFIGEGGKYSSDLEALESRATELYKELGDKILGLTFINTWFKVGEEGLAIGTDGSNIKMLLSNDALSFVDGGQTVAYFTQQSFYINRGAVVKSLQVGSHAMISIGAEDTVIQFVGGATA